MKSKLALSAVVALSALMGCNAPNRESSSTGGTTSTGGGGGGSGGATTGSGGTSSIAGGSSGGTSGKTDSGGTTSSGGAATGGATGSGGATASGGSIGSGGTARSGGASASGGSGGATASGGSTGSGGTARSGGASASGGSGGATASGGSTGSGGTARSGGASASGGSASSGGVTASGGSTGGSSGTGPQGPCDIYQSAGTPCAAAHSTVRALYAAYNGPLYQVRKSSGTKDIPLLAAGGFVDASVQDSFCPSAGTCTISIIYDQSPNHNDLIKTIDTLWLKNSKEADATGGKITVSGHTVYGVYINNPGMNVGYRNVKTTGMATGDQSEAMYMVLNGKQYSSICCFDYGNVETVGTDSGSGTMEAIYWGNSTQFQKGGAGSGPWVAADLENGMFECNTPQSVCSTNKSITWSYVTAMLKGPSAKDCAASLTSSGCMVLKAGNSQSGKLETEWDGARPPGYSPMKKQGAIVLGTGGDGSNDGVTTFWEGAIALGNPSDATDELVQANIVAAGYGK